MFGKQVRKYGSGERSLRILRDFFVIKKIIPTKAINPSSPFSAKVPRYVE
jgi:hypothetical protein